MDNCIPPIPSQANLGPKNTFLMLRNHGLLTCGSTIGYAITLLLRMEQACKTQIMTLSCNTEYQLPPAGVIDAARKDMANPNLGRPKIGDIAWPALLRRLDRLDPSYKH